MLRMMHTMILEKNNTYTHIMAIVAVQPAMVSNKHPGLYAHRSHAIFDGRRECSFGRLSWIDDTYYVLRKNNTYTPILVLSSSVTGDDKYIKPPGLYAPRSCAIFCGRIECFFTRQA